MKRSSYEIDMCNDPPAGEDPAVCDPLMLSGILQLLFNAADIIVVGQFTGSDALAAVGATRPLNNLIINLFWGCLSAPACWWPGIGAQDTKNVHEVVHTAMLVSAAAGVILIFLGILLAPAIGNHGYAA